MKNKFYAILIVLNLYSHSRAANIVLGQGGLNDLITQFEGSFNLANSSLKANDAAAATKNLENAKAVLKKIHDDAYPRIKQLTYLREFLAHKGFYPSDKIYLETSAQKDNAINYFSEIIKQKKEAIDKLEGLIKVIDQASEPVDESDDELAAAIKKKTDLMAMLDAAEKEIKALEEKKKKAKAASSSGAPPDVPDFQDLAKTIKAKIQDQKVLSAEGKAILDLRSRVDKIGVEGGLESGKLTKLLNALLRQLDVEYLDSIKHKMDLLSQAIAIFEKEKTNSSKNTGYQKLLEQYDSLGKVASLKDHELLKPLTDAANIILKQKKFQLIHDALNDLMVAINKDLKGKEHADFSKDKVGLFQKIINYLTQLSKEDEVHAKGIVKTLNGFKEQLEKGITITPAQPVLPIKTFKPPKAGQVGTSVQPTQTAIKPQVDLNELVKSIESTGNKLKTKLESKPLYKEAVGYLDRIIVVLKKLSEDEKEKKRETIQFAGDYINGLLSSTSINAVAASKQLKHYLGLLEK